MADQKNRSLLRVGFITNISYRKYTTERTKNMNRIKEVKDKIRVVKHFIGLIWVGETETLTNSYKMLGVLEDELSELILEEDEVNVSQD
ncbi:hypothetical protein [Liquorilactobacillus ghanensis]|nr:hypothetical protein [Liquorilactobacillus ghanensis]